MKIDKINSISDNLQILRNAKNQIVQLCEKTKEKDCYVVTSPTGNTITTEINHHPNMSRHDWLSYTVIKDKNNKLVKLIENYSDKIVTVTEEKIDIVSKF